MTNRLTVSKQNNLVGLFLWRTTDHSGTQLFRACSCKSSRENSLEFLEPRERKMVSGSLLKKVQEEAALLTSQIWKHRQMCSIREGYAVHQLHFTNEEKMKQRRQMPCPKSHSLIQSCMWNQSSSSFWVLCSLVLTTIPHTTQCTSVMIMTNLNREKPRNESQGNQYSISETKVSSHLTGRKELFSANLFWIPYFSHICMLQLLVEFWDLKPINTNF